MTDTYAIIETGGKQYRAEKGATLVVDRLPADEGDKVNLRAVMFRGEKEDEVVVAGSDLEKVKVEARSPATSAGRRSACSSTGRRRATASAPATAPSSPGSR